MMDIHRFSLAEIFSNSKGKSSASLLCGFMMISTACICFVICVSFRDAHTGEIIAGSTAFAASGSVLLGIRRWTQDKEISGDSDAPTKVTQTKTKTEETTTKVE